MINPREITNFHRTDEELEQFLFFAVCVEGRNARLIAKKVNRVFELFPAPLTHLSAMTEGGIRGFLESEKIGQYGRISKALFNVCTEIIFHPNADHTHFLRECSVEKLEDLVGLKTSRFFILHSREGARVAVLDVHILRWLKGLGHDLVGDSTPSCKVKYRWVEKIFLNECDKRGMLPATLDLEVWKAGAK